jgi:predicted dehydrogenase
MGKAHSQAYRDVNMFFPDTPRVAMQAICGRNEEAVRRAQQQFGWADSETDWRRLVERDDIDLIDINAPSDAHKDIAVAAAKAGKHVFCEKPLALNLADAREMLQAVEQAGVKHMICFNYRFVPAVRLAKKLITEGRIGRIYHFRGKFLQDWIVDPEFPLVWRLRKEIAGSGAHGDLNAHVIDLAHYLVGDIQEVVGMSETFVKERPLPEAEAGLAAAGSREALRGPVTVDDATVFLARFANGALGSIESTRLAPGQRCTNAFEINGSKGSIRFDFERMNELEVYFVDDPADVQGFRRIMVTDAAHEYAPAWWPPGHSIGFGQTFTHAVLELMQALKEDRQPAPNFADGVKAQAVLEAVERSIAERRWVAVSEM